MKSSILIATLVLLGPPLAGAVPHLVNLEGRLTDPSGNPIITSTQVEFRIYQGGDPATADSGTPVYKEVSTILPAPDGTYAHLLGGGSALENYQFTPGLFDTSQPVYLQLNINGQAVLPRLQIVSSPTTLLPEWPAGFIGMFSGDCPSGWIRFTALDNLFPMGGPSYGAMGGAATHSHNVNPHSHPISNDLGPHQHMTVSGADVNGSYDGTTNHGSWPFGSMTYAGDLIFNDANGSTTQKTNPSLALTSSVDLTHNHGGVTGEATATTDTQSNIPPYLTVVFCQKQ